MVFIQTIDHHTGFMQADTNTELGSELNFDYLAAKPFPHVVIDDFLPDELLEKCLASFPKNEAKTETEFNRDQERFKVSFNPDSLSGIARSLFYTFNSRPFIKVLENITGIRGLIPDPYFLGAGYHQINQGGHLSIHADFNHHKPMNLERRINVLIYLNKGWEPEFGGQLDLWDQNMTVQFKSIVPSFNRCVIFNTTESSMHGNPNPINHPQSIPRRSIALYYYTSTWDGTQRDYTTQFRVRPNTNDKFDWAVKFRELKEDFIPPIVLRGANRFKRLFLGPRN